MPELPEVETIRRALAPLVVGRRIVEAGGHPSPKFDQAAAARGATVREVRRRGKYLLAELDDGRELIVHLGMTGSLRVGAPRPGPDPYLRAWWALDDGQALELRDIRRFGRVAVTRAGDYRSLPTLAELGPEPFELTADAFWAALARSRAHLKARLLSQRPIAGVGNIYADEALWQARLHPARRRVSRPQAAALLTALQAVLQAGIDNGGTTLRDYRTVSGDEGAHQHHLECYGRAGLPCLRCGAPLKRRAYDGRTATFCAACQTR
ncbi:MAG: bifunctional DNA-formamidopyrimidine glycosylase/DNA-(apurinic or apyrimidinic site) lyase [Acidimicrobiales bacterium]